MEHKIAINALVRLHAEIGGKLKACRREADGLLTDIGHVEAVIRLLDPEFEIKTIVPVRRYRDRTRKVFRHGTVFRTAIDVLKAAEAPMTTREIAEAMLRRKGVEPTRQLVDDHCRAINKSLRNRSGNGDVKSEGWPAKWAISKEI